MLWNWYTINTCFIANSWHVRSKGGFAGSCIGVFFLVIAAQWLNRFAKEYDRSIVASKSVTSMAAGEVDSGKGSSFDVTTTSRRSVSGSSPELSALSHRWFLARSTDGTYPTLTQHFLRTLIFTLQWGLSYMIMLLFMYYNGYIIISCILGAFFGRFIFNYEPLGSCEESDANDRKCCRD